MSKKKRSKKKKDEPLEMNLRDWNKLDLSSKQADYSNDIFKFK